MSRAAVQRLRSLSRRRKEDREDECYSAKDIEFVDLIDTIINDIRNARGHGRSVFGNAAFDRGDGEFFSSLSFKASLT